MRTNIRLIILLCIAASCASFDGCQKQQSQDIQQTAPETKDSGIKSVLASHRDRLMQMPGVVGVGQGLLDETPCVVVMVSDSARVKALELPAAIDGYPVDVRVTGQFKALQPQ